MAGRWRRVRDALLRCLPDSPAFLGAIALLVVVVVVGAGVAIRPSQHLRDRVVEGLSLGAGSAFLLAVLHDKHIHTLRRSNQSLEQHAEERTAALRMRSDQLEEANIALESFSRNVAHDLRSPLTVVGGFVDLLRKETLTPKAKEYCASVTESVDSMHQIIDGLLALSKAHEKPKRVTLQPADCALKAIATLAPGAADVEIVQDMPTCEADPVLLQQLYVNLLSNALKFTRGRTPAQVKAAWNGSAYYVRDNGVGFSEGDDVDSMFTPFVRLKSAADHEGTGLGLAIVHTIVSSHGGRVWAEGERGWGATFFFTIGSSEDEG